MSDAANGHPRDLLSEYLDDELGLDERATVDRHLADCEDCRQELEALRRLARALAEENVPPVPDDFVERIGRRLDTATIVRPTRWRFAVPATIAATLGAVGLLIALQWRDGRVTVPMAPAPPQERGRPAFGGTKPSQAPPPQAAPEPEMAPPPKSVAPWKDALEQDLSVTQEQKLKRDAETARTDAAPSAPGGVAGGVVGGVVGGVEGGTEAGTAGGARDEVSGAAVREERAAAQAANEAPTLMGRASPAAAKAVIASVCDESWSDSGLRASWGVPDVGTAVRELNGMARDVGGTGVWRGVADGGPYVLAVPRARFEEVFFALRARGVAGLVEPPALTAGGDCTGISITLTAAGGEASPSPR